MTRRGVRKGPWLGLLVATVLLVIAAIALLSYGQGPPLRR